MSYSAKKHTDYVKRTENFIRNLVNAYTEARVLQSIYENEAGTGTHADFIAINDYTKSELQEAVGVMKRLTDALALDDQNVTINPENQSSKVTPFLQ